MAEASSSQGFVFVAPGEAEAFGRRLLAAFQAEEAKAGLPPMHTIETGKGSA